MVDQLSKQLRREKEQRAFDHKYYQDQISLLSRELAELRYEIAKRDREKAFAEAPSPSTRVH
jgi:prefoldin subunit 5